MKFPYRQAAFPIGRILRGIGHALHRIQYGRIIRKRGNRMKKTAIYVRQSADRADSVSLETQEALCRQDTAPDEPVAVYSDRGYSGRNTERPALQQMMLAAERGEIGRVLVYKLDRISRNLADFTGLLRIFGENGIAFSSHTEHFETGTPMGQAMQSLLMVFAQLERETISGRVRDAAFARAKCGFDPGGPPPFGFRKIPAMLLGRHTQMLSPDAGAEAVREAFAAYLTAEGSLRTVSEAWNRAGIRTARGGRWSSGSLRRLLRNPVYAKADAQVFAYLSSKGAVLCVPEPLPPGHGVSLYADRRICLSRFTDLHGAYAVCALHEGIVEPEIWLACQKKLDAHRRRRTAGTGGKTWLSGVLYCKFCGSAMTAVQGRSAVYLVCGGKKRGICKGAGTVWRADTAEELVGAVLDARLREIAACGGGSHDSGAAARKLQEELDAAMMQRERLIGRLTQCSAEEIAVLTEAAARIASHCETLRRRLDAAAHVQPAALPEWSALDFSGRKTAAQILLQGVFAEGGTLCAVLQ